MVRRLAAPNWLLNAWSGPGPTVLAALKVAPLGRTMLRGYPQDFPLPYPNLPYLSSCAQSGVGLRRGCWCLFLFRFRLLWPPSEEGVLACLADDGDFDAEMFPKSAEQPKKVVDMLEF